MLKPKDRLSGCEMNTKDLRKYAKISYRLYVLRKNIASSRSSESYKN
jgi:hypothetical protein